MKAKLHLLSVALLLAAASALADDLLDAVLWDGSSAFPAKTEPASTVPTVPAVPSVPPTTQSAAPDAPSREEIRLRRELEEMRVRTERLEAALQQTPPPEPAEPPEPAPPQYDRADWPKRARLDIHGDPTSPGCGGIVGEFAIPFGETPFDAAVRGSHFEDHPDADYGYTYYFSEEKDVTSATVWGIWYPLRNAVVSPYAGVGVGYESAAGTREYVEHNGRWGNRKGWEESLDDKGLTLAGRVGATLTLMRFTLKGEIILTSETKTFMAEAGLRVWEHLVLNALVERVDLDLAEPRNAVGGGITILF